MTLAVYFGPSLIRHSARDKKKFSCGLRAGKQDLQVKVILSIKRGEAQLKQINANRAESQWWILHKTKKKKDTEKKIDDCVKQALTLQMKIRIKWATRPRKQVRLIQVTPNSRIQVYSFTLYTYIEEMLCTKVLWIWIYILKISAGQKDLQI